MHDPNNIMLPWNETTLTPTPFDLEQRSWPFDSERRGSSCSSRIRELCDADKSHSEFGYASLCQPYRRLHGCVSLSRSTVVTCLGGRAGNDARRPDKLSFKLVYGETWRCRVAAGKHGWLQEPVILPGAEGSRARQ